MSCTAFGAILLLVLVGKAIWEIYLAIKHPQTFREIQQERRERRDKTFNAGFGIAKFVGRRKGW